MILNFYDIYQPLIHLKFPNFLSIQRTSFQKFLKTGLLIEFQNLKKITNTNQSIEILFYADKYKLTPPKWTAQQAILKRKTYTCQIFIPAQIINHNKKQSSIQWILLTSLPLMTKNGHFIVNGSPKIIMNQIIRSPGLYFQKLSKPDQQIFYSADFIAQRGTWLRLELDSKKGEIWAKMKKTSKIPIGIFLRCLGVSLPILNTYFKIYEKTNLYKTDNFFNIDSNKSATLALFQKGYQALYKKSESAKGSKGTKTQNNFIPLNNSMESFIELWKKLYLKSKQQDKQIQAKQLGKKFLYEKFLNPRLYNLSNLGRRRINEKLGLNISISTTTLTAKDILFACFYLIECLKGNEIPTDIDDLKNRQVRSAEQLIRLQLAIGLLRFEKSIQNKLILNEKLNKSLKYFFVKKKSKTLINLSLGSLTPTYSIGFFEKINNDLLFSLNVSKTKKIKKAVLKKEETQKIKNIVPKWQQYQFIDEHFETLVNPKIFNSIIREFFGTNPLVQLLDQTNPLAEITHKRRLSSLGSGGISRDTAGMAIRGIHPTHYGRICPIETPEGQNAGLVNSFSIYAQLNDKGLIETPFYKTYKGFILINQGLFFFSSDQEKNFYLIPGDIKKTALNFLPNKVNLPCRQFKEFKRMPRNKIDYMAIMPIQMISLATSLIPFLEHDDGNRALMGSNMQRQAVPTIKPNLPIVGTGLESRIIADIGHGLQAKKAGVVSYVDGKKIQIFSSPFVFDFDSCLLLRREEFFFANNNAFSSNSNSKGEQNMENKYKRPFSSFFVPRPFKFQLSFNFSPFEFESGFLKSKMEKSKTERQQNFIKPFYSSLYQKNKTKHYYQPSIIKKDSLLTNKKTILKKSIINFSNKKLINNSTSFCNLNIKITNLKLKKGIKKLFGFNNFLYFCSLREKREGCTNKIPYPSNAIALKKKREQKQNFHLEFNNFCLLNTKKLYKFLNLNFENDYLTLWEIINFYSQKKVFSYKKLIYKPFLSINSLQSIQNFYNSTIFFNYANLILCKSPLTSYFNVNILKGFTIQTNNKFLPYFLQKRKNRFLFNPPRICPLVLYKKSLFFEEEGIIVGNIVGGALYKKSYNPFGLGFPFFIWNASNIANKNKPYEQNQINKPVQIISPIYFKTFLNSKNYFIHSTNFLVIKNLKKNLTNPLAFAKPKEINDYHVKKFKYKKLKIFNFIDQKGVCPSFLLKKKGTKQSLVYKKEERIKLTFAFFRTDSLRTRPQDKLFEKKMAKIVHPMDFDSIPYIKKPFSTNSFLTFNNNLFKTFFLNSHQNKKNFFFTLGIKQKLKIEKTVTKKKKTSSYINSKYDFTKKSSLNLVPNKRKLIQISYNCDSFTRSNQDTYLVHKPLVQPGQWVEKGDLLADNSSSIQGELAIGQNILIGYLPWEGYNFEDAVLINQRLVSDDVFTSLHIERYEVEIRDTQFGFEQITANLPNLKKNLDYLNANGIVKLGTWVHEGDILVGKIAPIGEKKLSPYEKLLYDIIGKEIPKVKDTSLRVPLGVHGRVIHIEILENLITSLDSKKESSLPLAFQNEKFKKSNQNKLITKIKKQNNTFFRHKYFQKKGYNFINNYKTFLNFQKKELLPILKNLNVTESYQISKYYTQHFYNFCLKPLATYKINELKKSTNINNFLGKQTGYIVFSKKRKILKKTHLFFYNRLLLCSPKRKGTSQTKNESLLVSFEKKEKVKTSNINNNLFIHLKLIYKPNKKYKKTAFAFYFDSLPSLRRVRNGSNVQVFNTNKKLITTPIKTNSTNLNPHLDNYYQRRLHLFSMDFVRLCLLRRRRNRFFYKAPRLFGEGTEKEKDFTTFSSDTLFNSKIKNLKKNKDLSLLLSQQKKEILNYKKVILKTPLKIHIYIAEKRKVQIGDKIAGRHGNKGIISNILSRQDMPFLPDGTPLDLVLNPLGVPSRMNVGQIFECLLGLAGAYLGENYKIQPFDEVYGSEASRSLVYSKLYEARVKTNQLWLFNPNFPGKIRLFDGRTGNCFEQPSTVGKAYILKLVHQVDEKIHARSTGPYSLITQQPLRGRSKQGGQRVGEMEVWALEGFGAAYILQELLTIKSDDIKGRNKVMKSILNNQSLKCGTPESFKVLIKELQALCLDISIYKLSQDGKPEQLNVLKLL